jgi:DNA-binding CsgD family transcriptional regulator
VDLTDSSSEWMLALYRSARELPESEFQDHAIRLVQPLLGFESAIWGTGTTDGRSIRAGSAHRHEVDPAALDAWTAINGKDKAIAIGASRMGHTFQFHAPTLFSAPEDGEFRAYAQRWRRKIHLATGIPEPTPAGLQWMSLYRHADLEYSESQRQLCECLMPHLAEALRINRALGIARAPATPTASPEGAGLALADAQGQLHFAQAAFVQLLQREWCEFEGRTLPRPLQDFIAGHHAGTFSGRSIRCIVRCSADLFLIEAHARTAIDRLPPQRARIVRLYASGHSHKAIARQLRLAPSTVRNQIATAYRELGISSKAQLLAVSLNAAQPPLAGTTEGRLHTRLDSASCTIDGAVPHR